MIRQRTDRDCTSPPSVTHDVGRPPTGRMRLLIGLCADSCWGRSPVSVLAVIEFAAWVLIAPPRSISSAHFSRATRAHEPQQIPGEPIAIRAADGARLVGRWLSLRGPIATGKTVVLLHGFAEASSALEARRAAALNRHGWNVAVLDSRGYGQSEDPFRHSAAVEAGDIHAWLDSSRERTQAAHTGHALSARAVGPLDGSGHRHAHSRRRILDSSRWCSESPMVDLDVSMALVLGRRMIPFPRAHGPAGHAPGRQARGRADSHPTPDRLGPSTSTARR